jgi:hypothetical protein
MCVSQTPFEYLYNYPLNRSLPGKILHGNLFMTIKSFAVLMNALQYHEDSRTRSLPVFKLQSFDHVMTYNIISITSRQIIPISTVPAQSQRTFKQ